MAKTSMRLKEKREQEGAAKKQALDILSALAESTRLAIICLIWKGEELCLCELMYKLHVTQSRASRHMAVLEKAGLVISRRDAQWVRYKKNTKLSKETSALVKSALALLPQTSTKKGKCHEKH